jgi:hypothetical protein
MSTTTASSTMKCVTNSGLSLQSSSVSGQGQMSSQGQLQVTPQGLKIIVNASLKNSQNTSNNINLTSKRLLTWQQIAVQYSNFYLIFDLELILTMTEDLKLNWQHISLLMRQWLLSW